METVAGMASSVVDGALIVAKSAVAKEVALQLGVDGDLEVIKYEFELMQTYLMATNEERSQDPVAKVWARHVRDVAYDVEDYVEDFSIHLGGTRSSRWPYYSFSKFLNRRRIATEMKTLRARVDNASKMRIIYIPPQTAAALAPASDQYSGTLTAASAPYLAAGSTRSGPLLESSSQAGSLDKSRRAVEDDINRLSGIRLNKLLLARRHDCVMIVSMCARTTTTTLIGEAYDELAATDQFRCRAWVTVQRPFNQTEFIRSLLRQFHANAVLDDEVFLEVDLPAATEVVIDAQESIETMESSQLVRSLKGNLNHKRYLLVIDDIATREEWDSIKKLVSPDAKNASGIVVVNSQGEDMAKYCAGGHTSSSAFFLSGYNVLLPTFCNMDPMVDKNCSVGDEPGDGNFSASNPEDIDSASDEVEKSSSGIVIAERIRDRISTTMARVKEESRLVGREKEMEWIINKLMDVDIQNDNAIVAVCGMRGIGKTALVKRIYHRQDVIDYFKHRAWLTVLNPIKKDELMHSVLQQFKSTRPLLPDNSKDLVEFYEMNKCNQSFRCLIVVDGLSTSGEWGFINSSLLLEHYKGVLQVVVTTRELQVANYCSKNDIVYNLSRLHDADATKLFRLKVFRTTENLELGPDMERQANQILDKCGGIPFAIIHVGQHLSSRPRTAREWQRFNEHLNLDQLEGDPDLGLMRTTLESCYNSLPYHFKYCFLYLSIFHEDYNIMRRRLVKRWIAEGYVRGIRGSNAEDVGERIFSEFLSMTIIQPTKYAAITSGRVTSCSVHPLMLEVSMSKAMEEKLVCMLDDQNNTVASTDIIRHLVVRRSWRRDREDVYKRMNLSHVRSLTVFGEWRPFFLSCDMRMLRVLDLEGVEGLTGRELNHIGKFRHLRYLGLRSTHIEHLPKSVGKLQCLETLDIRYTNVKALPPTIVHLTRLRVLRSGLFSFFVDQEVYEHSGNRPWGVDVLMEMGELRDLTTLGTISIRRQDGLVIQELKKLTQLQKLSVTGITYENHRALCSTLDHLSSLKSLALRSDDFHWNFPMGFLESSLQHLEVLKLSGLFPPHPLCFSNSNNLRKLYLHNTRVEAPKESEQAEIMCALARLPNLTTLLMLADSIRARSLTFSACEFQELELLELANLVRLRALLFQAGSMPKLKTLQLSGCENLEELAFIPGATPKLETLQINGSNKLTGSALSGVSELQYLSLSSRNMLKSRKVQTVQETELFFDCQE